MGTPVSEAIHVKVTRRSGASHVEIHTDWLDSGQVVASSRGKAVRLPRDVATLTFDHADKLDEVVRQAVTLLTQQPEQERLWIE